MFLYSVTIIDQDYPF